jgi:Spy/CpxP family protein refolding chaperone
VKFWKVILATVVIFVAGAVAGGMLVKSLTPPPPKAPIPPMLSLRHLQERLKKELQLTADQTNRIDKVFSESGERVRVLWDLLSPEMQKERQWVYENVRTTLTAEQREKFEQLLKEPPRRPDQRRGPRGTNMNNSATNNGPRLTQPNNDSRI